MIIEFVGPTGSGKTLLSNKVADVLLKRANETLFLPYDLSNSRIFLDLYSAKATIRYLKKYKEFIYFSLKMLFKNSGATLTSMNLLRNIVRKIGLREFALNQQNKSRFIIIDEGIVHAVHNIFVHVRSDHRTKDLQHFSRICPLPELIVYVNAPLDVLAKRTMKRCDPPRRLRKVNMAEFLFKANTVFSEFISLDNIRERTLLIANDTDDPTIFDKLAEDIADIIVSKGTESYAENY